MSGWRSAFTWLPFLPFSNRSGTTSQRCVFITIFAIGVRKQDHHHFISKTCWQTMGFAYHLISISIIRSQFCCESVVEWMCTLTHIPFNQTLPITARWESGPHKLYRRRRRRLDLIQRVLCSVVVDDCRPAADEWIFNKRRIRTTTLVDRCNAPLYIGEKWLPCARATLRFNANTWKHNTHWHTRIDRNVQLCHSEHFALPSQ